jgi:hypothetical protein
LPKSTPVENPLTREIVLAQERLYRRVATLLRQVERGAVGRPGAPVPAASRAVVAGLLAEAKKLLGRPAGAGAAGEVAGLAVQLGQLLAELESFEARHAVWIAAENCICWDLPGAPRPISRLLPQKTRRPDPPSQPVEDVEAIRSKLHRRLLVRENHRYMQGYRHGQAGRAPLPPITRWDTDFSTQD